MLDPFAGSGSLRGAVRSTGGGALLVERWVETWFAILHDSTLLALTGGGEAVTIVTISIRLRARTLRGGGRTAEAGFGSSEKSC